VHGRFTVDSINGYRERIPEVQIIVHPECQHDVVKAADVVGSTEKIIRTVTDSAPGTSWAVGTELNLVNRLANENPDKNVYFLDRTVCYCSTMNRIDLPHLVWALESLVAGDVVNQIKVDEKVAHFSRLALEQMLAL
jgi:quinolinate synthase